MNRYFLKFILALILEKEEYIIKYKKCIKNSNKKNLPISFFFFYLLAFFSKKIYTFYFKSKFSILFNFFSHTFISKCCNDHLHLLNQKMV